MQPTDAADRALPKPVIAEVHGIATAAGCQLVATCDLAVAAEDARFATPGVNIGLFCSTPMVALSRNVSRKAAMEMLLTGEHGRRRRREGARPGQSRGAAATSGRTRRSSLARQIAAKSKRDAGDRQGGLLPPGSRCRSTTPTPMPPQVMIENMLDADAEEGIDAFIEKRQPNWPR